MSRPALLSSIALLVACSPAQPPPVVVAPAPPPSTSVAPPPPVSHAKWVTPSALEGGTTNAQLDLGAPGILQVGDGGRRWLVAPDGKVSPSPFLLPSSLVDARVVGTRLVLLGNDGASYVVDEPLGPAAITRAAPDTDKSTRKPQFTAGKGALLGIEADGTLLRSTDAGATWAKSKLPVRAGEDTIAIAANAKGEVLVLLYPQRVLLSVDDGATFTTLETPGIGAQGLSRDAKGDLWLEGAIVEKHARLVGKKLEVTDDSPAAFAARKAETAKPTEAKGRRHVIGDRVVIEHDAVDPATKRRKITISVEPFGGAASPPFTLAPAASSFARVRLAGHGKELVADVYEPEADPPSSKLFRSTDDGKSWQSFDTLEGREATGYRVLVAPDWVAVGELCDHDGQCRPARARSGAAKDWQPLGLPPRTRLSSVEYDAAHDRLVVVADDGKSTQIWAGKRSGKLARVEVHELDARPVSTTMTSSGAMLFAYASPWRIRELGIDGKVSPALHLPFDAQNVDFAGDHGLATGGQGAWETADAGKHWTKVAGGPSGSLSCAPSGCVQGDAVRVGWDLPDPSKPLVAAGDKEPTKKPGKEAEPPVDPGPPLKIACKPTGPYKKLAGSLWGEQRAALDGDVRFVSILGGEDSTTAIEVVKGAAAPTTIKMLPPAPKTSGDKVVREWVDTHAEGVVIARYTYVSGSKINEDGVKEYNPVDVDLAWYSSATGKAHKASLPKVRPFRVGRVAPSALHVITDGGLLFMPTSGQSPIYFVKDDGKTMTIPRPAGADPWGFTEGVKIGDRIVLAQSRGEAIALIESSDLGKTWTTKVWSTGEPAALVAIAGTPVVGLGLESPAFFGGGFAPVLPTGLVPVTQLTNDPPAAKTFGPNALALGKQGIVACDAKTRKGLRAFAWSDSVGDREIELTLPDKLDVPTSFSVSGRYSRISTDGSWCTDMLIASTQLDSGQVSLFEPTDDPAHSWLAAMDNDGKLKVRPFACTQ